MESLFVYGNLMEPNIQTAIFGRAAEWTHDVLFDYTKETVTNGRAAYTTIVPKRGFSVCGRIIYVTPEEMEIVQNKWGAYYRKAKLRLNSGKEAWVYVK
ncbi:MAG: gamma-glutamylcyclotransferase family protein [Candidatus Woesearchaeota archaeon]